MMVIISVLSTNNCLYLIFLYFANNPLFQIKFLFFSKARLRVSLACRDPDFDLAEGSPPGGFNSVDTCSTDRNEESINELHKPIQNLTRVRYNRYSLIIVMSQACHDQNQIFEV
jgi:hypothetical protein